MKICILKNNQNYSNLVSNCLGRLPEKSGHHTRVQHGSACNQTAPRSVRLFASCLNWISVWIMSRFDRIAIVFEKLLKVYTFSQTPQLLHVFETYTNPAALCCLCSHSANSNLAYMGKKSGQVVLIDLANTEKSPVEIVAHEAPVSCMALSHDGSKLATSSIKVKSLQILITTNNLNDFIWKGTLIRVFDADNGVQLHELRRGANNANIFW